MYMIARAISDEVRGKHNEANKAGRFNHPYGMICWAPVVNICRDRKHERSYLSHHDHQGEYRLLILCFSARWGRCQEGYGEDPYLQAELATQYITALQNLNASKYVEAVVS